MNATKDSFCWGLNSCSEFSMKSATTYGLYNQERSKWSSIGFRKLTLCLKLKCSCGNCHRALSVRGTLFRRGLNIDLICPFCRGDIKFAEHLFKDCSMVKKVWEAVDKHKWLLLSVSLAGC